MRPACRAGAPAPERFVSGTCKRQRASQCLPDTHHIETGRQKSRPGGLSYPDIARIKTGRARRFLVPARGAGGQGPGTRAAPRGALSSDLQRSWGDTPSLFYLHFVQPPRGDKYPQLKFGDPPLKDLVQLFKFLAKPFKLVRPVGLVCRVGVVVDTYL